MGFLIFLIDSFLVFNPWNRYQKDLVIFKSNYLAISFIRALILLIGLTAPIMIFYHEPIRLLAIPLDLVLLPLVSLTGAVIYKSNQKVSRFYMRNTFHFSLLILAVVLLVTNEWLVLKLHALARYQVNYYLSAIIHDLLFPLFVLRFVSPALAVFDNQIKLKKLYRLIFGLIVLSSAVGLIYSVIDFYH